MNPDLLLYEPSATGHHPEYVEHLLRAYPDIGDTGGGVVAALTPAIARRDPGFEARVARRGVRCAWLEDAPDHVEGQSMLARGRAYVRPLDALIRRHRPAHVLVMYLDHAQLGLGSAMRYAHPVRISGILFRHAAPARGEAHPGGRLAAWRKRALLWAMARNRHLDAVFSLDPTAAASLRRLGLDAVALPDPVACATFSASALAARRATLGIQAGRTLFAVGGVLSLRKGVLEALAAVALLEPGDAARVALLLAGPIADGLEARIAAAIEAARRAGVQVVTELGQMPAAQLQERIAAADVALVPYQRHVGSSAVLIRAAAAGRPVIAQEYGLVGAWVRAHALGESVDTGNPASIRDAIRRAIDGAVPGFDAAAAARFAAEHTPERYARTILERIGPARAAWASASHRVEAGRR